MTRKISQKSSLFPQGSLEISVFTLRLMSRPPSRTQEHIHFSLWRSSITTCGRYSSSVRACATSGSGSGGIFGVRRRQRIAGGASNGTTRDRHSRTEMTINKFEGCEQLGSTDSATASAAIVTAKVPLFTVSSSHLECSTNDSDCNLPCFLFSMLRFVVGTMEGERTKGTEAAEMNGRKPYL